jgi:flagellar hook-associated protein 3 FlgL
MIAISTNSLYNIPRNAVFDLQQKVAKAETEVSTNALADPVGHLGSQFGLVQSLKAQSSSLEVSQTANAIVQSKLSATQDTLTSLNKDAQTFVNALIVARNTGDIGSLKTQAQSSLTDLIAKLNTNAGGVYVFGGENSGVKPVADYADAAEGAIDGAFASQFGFPPGSSQVNEISETDMQNYLAGTFSDQFDNANWAANWSQASSTPTSALISQRLIVTTSASANDTAFKDLASAYVSITSLDMNNLGESSRLAVLDYAINQVSRGMSGVDGLRTSLGVTEGQIKSANTQLQTQQSLVDKWYNQLGGVDPYDAAAKLTNLMTQLETAYSLTSRITKLGLVHYLS